MHFTREPIIESVLSARDGYKLVLKNSKLSSTTDISAEVIEIVSFAGTLFYRSQDRSKNFLLPASDFEISEIKDARLVLKNISLEKSSKLQNIQKEAVASESTFDEEEAKVDENQGQVEVEASTQAIASGQNNRLERRRERRRNRRRRHSEERQNDEKKEAGTLETNGQDEVVEKVQLDETSSTNVAPVLNLIPPPTTLISQTLARYKEKPQETEVPPAIIVEENFNQPSFETPLEPEDLV